jgi:hypothetical protein
LLVAERSRVPHEAQLAGGYDAVNIWAVPADVDPDVAAQALGAASKLMW